MGDDHKYHILVVDDYAPVRRMVKEIIKADPGLEVVGEFADGRQLLKFLKKDNVNLILLDISMPNLGGFEATQKIKRTHPEVKVLILTIHKYIEYAERAMSLGAEGYLLKEDVGDELLPAISSLRQGQKFISPGVAA